MAIQITGFLYIQDFDPAILFFKTTPKCFSTNPAIVTFLLINRYQTHNSNTFHIGSTFKIYLLNVLCSDDSSILFHAICRKIRGALD